MHILGLSFFYHDSAAALLRDGALVAAAEEERFSRIKHDFGFPDLSIAFCLEEAGITAADLDYVVFYEKPDKLRILGYHPFGMGVFDALYRGGEFVLFSPLQNRAYTGEISEFGNLIAKANVRISAEKPEGSDVPNRIRIEMPEKETRLDVKLKEIAVNQPLPNDAFQWVPPEGVEIKPLAQFLKGKKFE